MLKWRAGDPAKKESAFDVFELTEGRWQWVGTMRTAEHARRAADAVNHGYMLTIGRSDSMLRAVDSMVSRTARDMLRPEDPNA